MNTSGPTNPKIRSDMVYIETRGDGCVFSVGSIHWLYAMAWANYANNVAKITENLIRGRLVRDVKLNSRKIC